MRRHVDVGPSNGLKLTVDEDPRGSTDASEGSQKCSVDNLEVWCIKTMYSDFVFSVEI